jgi:Holliday junction resolvasome RuvABC endonuclease subunit
MQVPEVRVVILTIDPGTSCGFAIGTTAGQHTVMSSGVWDLKPMRGESDGMRFNYLRSKLHIMHRAYPKIDLVCYEDAFQIGLKARQLYDGYVTHIQSWCADKNINYTKVHAMTLKKHATGSGRASKADMRAAALKRGFVLNTDSDDEVDAIWIFDYAATVYGG